MLRKFSGGGNPMMRNGFSSSVSPSFSNTDQGTMTVQGAINKTFILFAIMLVTAFINFQLQSSVLMIGGAVGGLILVIVNVFKKEYSTVIAPSYAALEGLLVGGVTGIYAGFGGGIVIQAISLTLLVLFVMLVIYKTGIIPITNQFRMGVIMATGAIALMYVLTMVLGMFGIHIPYIHEGGTIGIIFSLGVIAIASLNLLLDFDMIVKGEQNNFPKYMEWFSAMGLMITLVWLYFEILRLLGKMRN
ncbi:MAG: Bax inhibitor-1/YccA family protein [Saprospiraceae bacterium]